MPGNLNFRALLLVVSFQIFASPENSLETGPWFTGPLLASSSLVVPKGHVNEQPYLWYSRYPGSYAADASSESLLLKTTYRIQSLTQIGLTAWMDLQIIPSVSYNHQQGKGTWVFEDLPVALEVQLYSSKRSPAQGWSAVKVYFQETFPTGRYQNLSSSKAGTDQGGEGVWGSALGVVWGRLFSIDKNFFLSTRAQLQYSWPSSLSVRNQNAYGGSEGTLGTVYTGAEWYLDLALEANLTQHWAVAIDVVGNWIAQSSFIGDSPSSVGLQNQLIWSLAPALEYNWSANLGVIGGAWFSIFGKNAQKFQSFTISLNYYH